MSDKKLIHVVDDEDSIRRSIGFMLKTSGYEVETWSSGQAFLKDVKHGEQGCILLDVRMPEIDGLEVQRQLAERGVMMPIVIMTGHGDISIAIQAMKGGAEKASLIGAIEEAFQRIANTTSASARAAEAESVLGVLTPREHDVLHGLAKGLPNKTIAYDLGISPRTVEVHRANVMTKLQVRSLSDALRIAFAAGLGA
jgi:two-component system response regulator FixJ